MSTDNSVVLVGNLTDDPELRFTTNGIAVASFRLAVTPRIRDGETWRDGDTTFVRVNVWRDQAENVADSLRKGARAIVLGRLKTRAWETPDGDKRNVIEVEADELGASLKWAVATTERAKAAKAAPAPTDEREASAAAPTATGQARRGPRPVRA